MSLNTPNIALNANIYSIGFTEECKRQSALVGLADLSNSDLMDFLDQSLLDLEESQNK